jgi:hypothetical protein
MKSLSFLIAIVFFISCTTIDNSIEKNIYQDAQMELKELVSSTTKEIISFAYIDGAIDYQQAQEILNSKKPKNIDYISLTNIASTKSENSVAIRAVLSPEQLIIFDKVNKMASYGTIDYNIIKKQIMLLTIESERNDMLAYICVVEAIEAGIKDSEIYLDTKSGWFGSFICNMATGGIGAIYGAWGGAIIVAAGIATGGAALLGGLFGVLVGSTLSTIACR